MVTNKVVALKFWFDMEVQIKNIGVTKRELESDCVKNALIKGNITNAV